MSCASDLIPRLHNLGVQVVLDGGDLLIRPGSRLPPELLRELRERKTELVTLLSDPEGRVAKSLQVARPRMTKPPWEAESGIRGAGLWMLDLMRHQEVCEACGRRPGVCRRGLQLVKELELARKGGTKW